MKSTATDVAAQPQWLRTGYRFFPDAAHHSGQWWVLSPAADITANAAAVVRALSRYVNYGSEHDDPCIFCSEDYDPMARI